MGRRGVRLGGGTRQRRMVGVDHGGSQPRNGVDQRMLGVRSDSMGLDDGQVRGHDDVGLGAQRGARSTAS